MSYKFKEIYIHKNYSTSFERNSRNSSEILKIRFLDGGRFNNMLKLNHANQMVSGIFSTVVGK